MIPNGTAYDSFPSFADSGTRVQPSPAAKYSQGYVPGDTYPAEWANYFYHGATSGITRLNSDTDSIKKELNTILSEYGITNNDEAYNQLYTALRRIAPQICTSDTAAGTAAKLVAITGDGTVLKTGNVYSITFANANTAANPTLSINGGTAYPMTDARGIVLKSGAWSAGDVVTVLFTGTKFLMATNAVDAIENGNQNAVTSNAVSCISAANKTITGPRLGTGGSVKINFTADITGTDTTTALALNYNGSNVSVKVNKDGSLSNFVAKEVSAGTYKYLQANTTLELFYNGTNLVIVGNPVVISSATEKTQADGTVVKSAAFKEAGALATYGVFISEATEALDTSTYAFNVNYAGLNTEVGTTLKLTFENALQSNVVISSVTLTAGGKTGNIVAARPGILSTESDYVAPNLRNLRSHVFAGGNYSSSYPNKVWDKFTTLEVMWTGTYWLVMGDAVLCAYNDTTNGYTVHSNGLIEQFGQVTSTTNWFNFNVVYNSSCMINATRMTGGSSRGYITTFVNSNLAQFQVVGWSYGDSSSKNSVLSSYYSKGY